MEQAQANAAQGGSFKNTFNLVVALAEIGSMSVEVLMHERVGARFVRIRGGLAAGIIILFAGLFAATMPVWPLMVFLLIFWGRCIAHGAIWSGRLRRREPLGDQTTYFPGSPLICRLMPGRSEQEARWAEVAILFVAGMLISILNIPLGTYLVFSSFGLCLTLYLRYQAVLNKLMDMHDAVVLQRGMAEQFRERSGG